MNEKRRKVKFGSGDETIDFSKFICYEHDLDPFCETALLQDNGLLIKQYRCLKCGKLITKTEIYNPK